MIPPSDSISHHSRKLAEFAASLQNRSPGSAPPPYSSNPPAVPVNEETFGAFEEETDDGLEAQLAPISVKIDASINVDGEANTVVMPPFPSSATSPSSPSSSSTSSDSSSSCSTPQQPLHQLQQRQRTKSAMIAQTIISTLQSSGALEDTASGKQRPLDVCVNAGVNIRGARNVVCLGVPATITGQPPSPEGNTPSRKRRAESVCPAIFLSSPLNVLGN